MVSVIVPNYNHAPYLKQRIESILAQSWQDFELIILDDHSTDDSRTIMETYRHHPKVKQIVYNTVNGGNTFYQWKKGVELAAHELIWMAESDDWCEPGFLEEMVQAFQLDTSLVLAHCQLQCIRDGIIEWRTQTNMLSQVTEGRRFNINQMLGVNNLPNASAILFKKSAFSNIASDYKSMRYAGDWLIWSEICRQGSVFTSGKYLSYFRKHAQDVSGKASHAGLDFKEGNVVFRLIAEKEKPSREEIVAALDLRLKRFHLLKHQFTDGGLYSFIQQDIMALFKQYGLKDPFHPLPLMTRLKDKMIKLLKGSRQ